jgi:Bacterial SH3 domain
MRALIAAGLLVLSTALHAALPTPIHGINQHGEEFTIDIPDPPFGRDYSVQVKTNGKVKDYFAKEPITYSKGELAFSAQGRSPLAGAKFKIFSKAPYFGGCGTVLTCIEGCGPRVPHELFEDPYECYPEPEVACGSPIDEGIVDGDVVNVRDNPHINSRVLRTVANAVRITVLKRDPVCFLMNDKEGQWVRVKLHDDNPIKEGWVFDAYIKYEYHPK